ncbi:MAG: hypothetical protein EA338_01430 [Roseinatronobacter sp.]|nr:MAG: hypothetical protein EA338_01430 [Roseinatronobacter sp.]
MLPAFDNEQFLTQIAELRPKGTFNSYLLSLTALMNGYDLLFYRSQKEANTNISHFPAEVAHPVFFSVKSGKKLTHFSSSRDEADSLKAHRISTNKSLLKAFLAKAGINVPYGGAATLSDLTILTKMKQANVDRVSVKPIAGKGSRGVSLNQTLEEAEQIIRTNPNDVFMVEQMIRGAEFRVTASKTDAISAQMIVPPHIIGDGQSTIFELIEREEAARKRNPTFMNKLLDREQVLHAISLQGWQANTVLKKDKILRLSTDGLPNRAFRVPVLDRLPTAIKDIAKQTVQLIGGSICGLDILTDRAGVPYILDIDAISGMWFECFPYPTGEWNLDVPEYILKKNFKKHRGPRRQILSYDYKALREELLRDGRTTRGVNPADFVVFG